MLKEDPTLSEKFFILRELTKTTGALHEAQVNQLRIWLQILFEEIDHSKATLNWSIPEKDYKSEQSSGLCPTVIYKFKTETKDYLNTKQKNIIILVNSIRTLLGKTWKVKFIVNGKHYDISA
jgi:hypothetical protein